MEIKILKEIMEDVKASAKEIREHLKGKGVFMVNVMGSPGSGKTSLIRKLIEKLAPLKAGVIEGDIETTRDAEQLAGLNVPVMQINTAPFGGECHLEPSWILSALKELPLEEIDCLFVENVGNLVCPAEFDIGAHLQMVVLSVTEGEDKPLKYPLAFRVSHIVALSKIDLLPYLSYRLEQVESNIKKTNPELKLFALSAEKDKGVKELANFLKEKVETFKK